MTEFPQVIAIVSIGLDGRMNLKKDVKKHLGMKEHQKLFLDISRELILSTDDSKGGEVESINDKRIRLPEEALEKLGISKSSLVGLVERNQQVAIKKVEIVEKKGR